MLGGTGTARIVSYLSSVEQEMVLSFALSITRPGPGPGFPPSSMLDSIMLAFSPQLRSAGKRTAVTSGEGTSSPQLGSFSSNISLLYLGGHHPPSTIHNLPCPI